MDAFQPCLQLTQNNTPGSVFDDPLTEQTFSIVVKRSHFGDERRKILHVLQRLALTRRVLWPEICMENLTRCDSQ